MKAFFVSFIVVAVALASAQVYRRPDDLRYPYAKFAHAHDRPARDIKVDPQTGTVTGEYPVAGGDIFAKVEGGTDGQFGYKGNIFDNNNGKLDGSVYHGRTLGASGDTSSLGGRLDWTDGRGSATVDVNRFNHGPTTLNAAGGGTWPLNKNWDVSAQGTYSQVFGQGRPDFGVLGSINGRF